MMLGEADGGQAGKLNRARQFRKGVMVYLIIGRVIQKKPCYEI